MMIQHKRRLALLLFLLTMVSGTVISQITYTSNYTINISAISLIRVYPAKNISMIMLTNTAGSAMTDITDATTYLQLTTVIASNQSRKITASMTGKVPTGTLLKLKAQECTSGSGNFGSLASQITLSTTAQTLIEGIGSAYTGRSSGQGYNLIYTFTPDPNNMKLLYRSTAKSVTITYTITSG